MSGGLQAPDMSQGKAGRVPRCVRGADAASCSALPDPGCSRGSRSAGSVRTGGLNHGPVSAVLVTSTLTFFPLFFFSSPFYFPHPVPLVHPSSAGPAPSVPRLEGCMGQTC